MNLKESRHNFLYFVVIIILVLMLAALFILQKRRDMKYASEYKRDSSEYMTEESIYEDEMNTGEKADTEDKTEATEEKDSADKTKAAEKKDSADMTQEDENSKSASNQDSEKIFNDLKGTIKEKLPGIVCWGDSGMAGNSNGSLPEALTKTVNDSLLGSVKKDLSARSASLPVDELDIPVTNMGVGQEGFHEIMVRTGASPLIVGEDYEIAGETEKKNIVLCDEPGNSLRFSKSELDKFGQVTIGKVKGHFYEGNVSYDEHHSNLAFGRDEAGDEAFVSEGTEIHTEGAEKYRTQLPVLFFNDRSEISAGEMVKGIDDTVSLYNKKKYVVIISCTSGGELDKKCAKEFKDHYIRLDQSDADLTGEEYKSLSEQVYECLKGQGAFDDITAAAENAGKSLQR